VRSPRLLLVLLLVGLLLLPALPAPAAAAAPPTLPVASWGGFLSGISLPTLSPGASGVVSFAVSDPLSVPIGNVELTFGIYAFNAYPGNATGPVPANGPDFSGPGTVGDGSATIAVGNHTPGGPSFTSPGTVALGIGAPSGAPEGTYAIRTSLSFLAGGTSYRLESRGFFTTAEWENATSPPGAPSSLNVTRLGVAGVIPETAILVRSNPFPVVLAVVVSGAAVLAAVGGYWAVRRGPRSRSGATVGPPPSQAETALGNSRSSDGD
jgi:hypothetical protein